MFQPTKTFSGYSVDNIEKAQQFYGEVLGLKTKVSEMGTLNITLPDGGFAMLYEKPDHQPATYTTLNFIVDDIESTVAELKNGGVPFESYDLPDLKTDDDNISRGGEGPTIAWFTDPAGNILSVIQE